MLWSIGGIDAPRAPLHTVDYCSDLNSEGCHDHAEKRKSHVMAERNGGPCNCIANCGTERLCIIGMLVKATQRL